MTNATVTENTVTENTATTVTAPVVTTPAAPKAPSKKSQALAIFSQEMAKRADGKFASNKEFRAAVLNRIEAELEVSRASSATMYNAAKKEAEAADATVGLGRDPKKEKPAKVEGAKRGRPQGSKNKPKEVVAADATAPSLTIEVAADTPAPAVSDLVIEVAADAPVAPASDAEAVPA